MTTGETQARAGAGLDACRVDGHLPLVALLAGAHDAFALDFDARLAASGLPGITLTLSRTILRHLSDGPTRASHLVEPCGMTKQAVSQQIAQLQRGGYIESCPDPADQRARLLVLTPRGEQARATVRRLFAEIEADWARELGVAEVAALRRVLEAAVDRPPGA